MDAKSLDGYVLEDTLGSGHFGVVKKAHHVTTGAKVAVKVIDKMKLDSRSRDSLFREVRCMKRVEHPNIVRLYQVIDTRAKLYLVLELGEKGDLYDYISTHQNGVGEDESRDLFRQIVEAVSYCHEHHVVHRDLKPENVIFCQNASRVKLTDFGLSNLFDPGANLKTSCGSLAYSPPEILLGDTYDAPAVDRWGLGVILYMLLVGEKPFVGGTDSETLTMIMDCKFDMPSELSSDSVDLVRQLLVADPKKRISLDDIFKHPWMTQGDHGKCGSPRPLLDIRSQLGTNGHEDIIEEMLAEDEVTREEIESSLESNKYNYISTTYHLRAALLLGETRSQESPQSERDMERLDQRRQCLRKLYKPGRGSLVELSKISIPRTRSADHTSLLATANLRSLISSPRSPRTPEIRSIPGSPRRGVAFPNRGSPIRFPHTPISSLRSRSPVGVRSSQSVQEIGCLS